MCATWFTNTWHYHLPHLLKKQEGLNRVGKESARFVTLYVIQTLLPPKPVVKHLKFKVEYLTVILRRLLIF